MHRNNLAKVGLFIGLISGGVFNSQSIFANVSLRNGNFFISYTDIIYSGGSEAQINRTYNSKSPTRGWFGWGWGNQYEVNLTVSADGSIFVREFGGGAENRFNSTAFKSQELDKAIENLAKASRKSGAMGNPAQLEAYKKKLREDATFRNDQWESLRSQELIEARQLAAGTQLQSNRFSYQYITKMNDGYVRNFADTGRIEKFDNEGHLVRVSDKNQNFIAFEYSKNGLVTKITDNFNRKMFFEHNSHGLVTKIEGENSKKATYSYNSRDELIQSRDVDGNVYSFSYDSAGRHNMTQIGYPDKTSMLISYFGPDRQENVHTVKDRDGSLTENSYESDPSNPSDVTVSVVTKKGSEVLTKSKYQYVMKRKATGEEWTYKLITDFDGDKTETTYNECCGLPLNIREGKDETSFEYDVKGHVTKKTTPYDITELRYDPKVNKVAKVIKYSKSKKKQMVWSEFQYDSAGNLVFAKNSEGKGDKLIYDTAGRIRTIIDQNKGQINFKYNENSKPVEITDPALGSINVSYKNSGEIKEVTSNAGRKIAAQVTAEFQNLLDIIRPAGVTLSL